MKLPKSLQNVVDGFEMLPGIGPKSAQRLAFYLLRMPKDDVVRFANSLLEIKTKTHICKNCYNVGDDELCEICSDLNRQHNIICVVESPLDVLAIERSGYKGAYHVLHGVINPLAGVGPEEIFIEQLFDRLQNDTDSNMKVNEIILATSTSLEGESTAMYINREIRKRNHSNLKVTRIGKGLPIGADIEFADEGTLSDALSGRSNFDS